MVREISPLELKGALGTHSPPLVLDVRESWELAIARLAGTLDIPMGSIATHLAELPRDREIVVMCRSGGRSLKVAQYLQAQGFRTANLSGGILAWARDVDPGLPSY